ncbi:hypothetical protein O0882_14895 [Janthinobacterium sp. SUN073]|uniref:hypothetical protein n=1 Tax=Janthinobacterium sp. SUN073 TaxID=3004102 RepID=UPI0025B20205|nr:hypothetical protein [Janthinobacterium sp. SUN073]MDN2697609.1 hypothetical protein [Janthinobacterium sp. SUN073]
MLELLNPNLPEEIPLAHKYFGIVKIITSGFVDRCQTGTSIVRRMFDETQGEFNRTPVDTCKIFTEHDSS